jgi:pimeloyl-ACP methyl ester carboxylesterase
LPTNTFLKFNADFTIDGVANVAADRVAYSPPSAAVEEFKIQTASYDAAVGNAMGASVNLVTKSGTNSLRGQVYEWFRGAKLDANNYFDEKAGRPKRDYNDNRFGAAVGGPITRSRTFYFANFEANPFQVPSPATLTVPTQKMRTGDFSELLALGSQYQIYDPATTRPHPTQAGRFIRDPFPGNIIPQNRLDSVAKLRARRKPTLILHTRNDSLVDVSHAERLATGPAENVRLVLFPEGDHNTIFADNRERYVNELRELIELCARGETRYAPAQPEGRKQG